MSQFDLVVRAGSVLDGTGSEPYTADIGVKDGIIQEIGRINSKTYQEVDADGAIVTPGFVDIHTHYDGQATWSNRMSPSSHHGVTTAVMGNCGVGFAPVRAEDHDLLIELMEGVEDIPGVALHEGLSWDWESFEDYMDHLSARQFDMDIGAQLPHAAMRVYVMGQRGADREPATPSDVAQMKAITSRAIQAGALGFTTSRTLNHRSAKGEPTPTLTAEAEELLGISEGIRDVGTGVIEMISDFDELDLEFDLLKSMVKKSGRPMSISLAQGISPHGWRTMLDRIENANRDGLVMRGQVAPRAIGVLLGLTTTLSPFSARPSFSELGRMSVEEKLEALKDPERKKRILQEAPGRGFERLFKMMGEGRNLWLMSDPPDYEPSPEASLHAVATREGKEVWSYIYDCMLGNDGKNILYTPFANYAEQNLDCCRDMILHENTVMGLGDGGAHVGTICDASFITSLLTHWGRDRVRGEQIDLPTLVKSQTRDTALAVDLSDRGTIQLGKRADLNVIDFDNLNVSIPEIVHDLPAGGARLQQKSEGYLATICRGSITYRFGNETEHLPGRLIRKTGSAQ